MRIATSHCQSAKQKAISPSDMRAIIFKSRFRPESRERDDAACCSFLSVRYARQLSTCMLWRRRTDIDVGHAQRRRIEAGATCYSNYRGERNENDLWRHSHGRTGIIYTAVMSLPLSVMLSPDDIRRRARVGRRTFSLSFTMQRFYAWFCNKITQPHCRRRLYTWRMRGEMTDWEARMLLKANR